MSKSLDERLTEYFQPETIKAAFLSYEEQKKDFFQEQNEPKIQMGADGISYKTFKNELDLRCKFISKRLLKGTYQFYPFREVDIPKPPDGKRTLSISTIRDALVQKLLYEAIYNEVEKDFKATPTLDKVSCAYRKGKSAPYAAIQIHRYIKQGFKFALDADIVKFFDNIPHQRLISLVENKFGKDTLATNLLRCFIKTGGVPYTNERGKYRYQPIFHHYKPNRKNISRNQGIPQGGVLSGMLANLYLHEFDCWILKDLSKKYSLRYVRYADDFVILLKQKELINLVRTEVAEKLQEIKLELHTSEKKTKCVDIDKDSLEFVGFQFTLAHIRVKEANIDRFQTRIKEKIKKELNYKTGEKPERRFNFFIKNVINRKVLGRGETICSECGGVIGERVKSWMGFFLIVTDIQQLRELDKWIRKEVSKHFYKNYQLRLKKSSFKQAELVTLEKEYYRLHKRKICRCNESSCSLTLTSDDEVTEQSQNHSIFLKQLVSSLVTIEKTTPCHYLLTVLKKIFMPFL
jgi:retron-type reverse transcriptase